MQVIIHYIYYGYKKRRAEKLNNKLTKIPFKCIIFNKKLVWRCRCGKICN